MPDTPVWSKCLDARIGGRFYAIRQVASPARLAPVYHVLIDGIPPDPMPALDSWGEAQVWCLTHAAKTVQANRPDSLQTIRRESSDSPGGEEAAAP